MLLPETQRLLKANAVRELGSRVAYNFSDLQQQGEVYLSEVRQQAHGLIQAAQQEAEAIRQAAFRESREQGRREGLQESARLIDEQSNQRVVQQMNERVATALPALAAVAETLRQERDHWLIRWEEAAVRTAVAIAEKLLHHALDAQPQRAQDMITEALRLAAGHPQLRIHLHPEDIGHWGEHAEEVIRSITSCADAQLIPDAALTRGGCRIETRHGGIDARLETMLNRIAEELLA